MAAGTPSVAPERTAASDTLQVVRKALEAARCEATAAEVTRDFKVAVEAARYAKELAAIANREQDGKAYTRAYNNIFQRKRRAPPANPSQICRASPIELVLILADLAAAEGSLGQLADAVAAGTPSVAPERTAASKACRLRARRSPRRAARGQLPRLLAPSRSPSRQHATPRSSRPLPTAIRTGRRAGELATNGVTGASLTPSPRSSPTWRPRRARWAS